MLPFLGLRQNLPGSLKRSPKGTILPNLVTLKVKHKVTAARTG
jgi:hypothetical protein